MEKFINIDTPDKHKIYGVFHSTLDGKDNNADSTNTKNKKLVIFVHGYTGNCYEHFFFNASPFFNSEGFDTYRFNLYWYEGDARHLSNATFDEHLDDLNTVISFFENDYDSIYLVGHSLGGQVVIRSNLNDGKIKAITLWDPSREPKDVCATLRYNNKNDNYVEDSNVEIIIGKRFYDSCMNISESTADVLSKISVPIKVIGAGKAGASVAKDLFFTNIVSEKEVYIIENSNHTFDNLGAEKELFNETLNWFVRF